MSFLVGVLCEGPTDHRYVLPLVERALVDAQDWLESIVGTQALIWRGLESGEPYLAWSQVKARARGRRIKVHGKFRGFTAEASTAYKAFKLFALEGSAWDAVLVLRDTDHDMQRHPSLGAARQIEPWPFVLVLGVQHPCLECWQIAGFEPCDARERALLEPDMRERTHTLKSKDDYPDSAKVILRLLTGGDEDRIASCLTTSDLSALRARGVHNGLDAFLEEVVTLLLPVFNAG